MAQQHLSQHGSTKEAFEVKGKEFGFHHGSEKFVPIFSIRLEYPLKVESVGQGSRKRFVKTGSNHHMEVFRCTNARGDEKWRSCVLSTLEAFHRQKEHLPVVRKEDAEGNELAMALHIGDMLLLEIDGQTQLCRVQKMAQSGVITLRLHSDARKEKGKQHGEISKTAETLRKANARKVYVSVLGKLKGQENEPPSHRN